MNLLTCGKIGADKAVTEPNRLRRLGYRLLGEIHIPGRIRLNHVVRTIESLRLPPQGCRMLDAGTGHGDVALYFSRRQRGWSITGVDSEEASVERCRAAAHTLGLANVQFRLQDLVNLRDESQYDLIVNSDVLEHITNDQAAVTNMARALKPGGHLLLTFPSLPQRRHLKLVAWREQRIGFRLDDIGHVREGYSPEQAGALLAAAQLQPCLIRWTYGPFGTFAHDIFFVIGDNNPNPAIYALFLPFLLTLSFLESRVPTAQGSGLLLVARKPGGRP